MSRNHLTKSDLASGILRIFPPLLRGETLEDHDFRQQVGLATDAVIRLDNVGVAFQRSSLFSNIRRLYENATPELEVLDKNGLAWRILLGEDKESIIVKREDKRASLPNFACLSPSRTERLTWFDREAARFELNDEHSRRWRRLLSDRPTQDEEVDQLLSEFRLTPLFVSDAITMHLGEEELNMLVLVPSEIRYYERLVGALPLEGDLQSYIETRAQPFFEARTQNGPEGLRSSFLLSSHPFFPNAIPLDNYLRNDVEQLFARIEETGDRISQVGAIEAGLLHLDKFPELEPHIVRMAELIAADDADDPEGRMTLLSSLIVLVLGEMARTSVAKDKPVFWRRLAAIAQASVIERAVVATKMPPSFMKSWAFSARGALYYLDSYIDMRREPRWLPDFVSRKQLKAELIGRIFSAGVRNATKLKSDRAKALFSLDDEAPIKSHLKFPYSYLPGPLEGGVESIQEMPLEIETDLRKALESEQPASADFISLVNSPLIFKVGHQLAQLAAQALRRAKHQLREMKNPSDAFPLLSGLATVAAVTRSTELADEVRKLSRVLRRKTETDIAPEDALRIAMICAAANAEKNQWCNFVGDWLTEISFEDMSREAAANLHAHVRLLCTLEPNLWETCGRADASLSAYLDSFA